MIINYLKSLKIYSYLAITYYKFFTKVFGYGYERYKQDLINNLLNKKNVNPISYIDERIVEIPWIMEKLRNIDNLKILDAGCTLNYKYLIEKIIKNKNKISFVNLYREKYSHPNDLVSYIDSDISNLNIENKSYNIVTCISVLEHIGFDNQMYNNHDQKLPNFIVNKELYIKAISEIHRVLTNEGVAYLSFPYGQKILFDNLQQFDENNIIEMIKVFQPKSYTIHYHKYFSDEKKWKEVSAKDCKNSLPMYFDRKTALSANSVALMVLNK